MSQWRACPKQQDCAEFYPETQMLDSISLSDGTMVTGEQCLVHLLETSFPGFRREYGELFAYEAPSSSRARKADWELAADIVKPEKVRWAVKTFKPYKSARFFRLFFRRGWS